MGIETVAIEWARTDPLASREDVQRLGVEEAAGYALDLAAIAAARGDDRWQPLVDAPRDEALAAMRAALTALESS